MIPTAEPPLSPLSIQTLSAFDAEAVTAQVVVAAGRADEAPRRIRLEPALIFSTVPDAVFRSQHPAAPLAVEHGKVSDRQPVRAGWQPARAPLADEKLVAGLGLGERIDCHAESIARSGRWNLDRQQHAADGELALAATKWASQIRRPSRQSRAKGGVESASAPGAAACVAPHPEAHVIPQTAPVALFGLLAVGAQAGASARRSRISRNARRGRLQVFC